MTYVDEINQFIWSLTIFVLFTCSVIYLSRCLKKEDFNEKSLMLGFAGVSFGLAFNQFFWFLSKILIHLEEFFDLIAILSFAIGMTFFFFIFDILMKKTKYIPFIINLILIPLIVGFFIKPFYFNDRFFVYICYIFNTTTFCLILLWFSMKSRDEFKIVSILLLTGAILYIIGAILSSIFIKELISITPIISYSFLVAGAIFFVSPVYIKPKEKSQVKLLLIIGSTIYIISLFLALYIVIYFILLYQVNYLILIIIFIVTFGSTLIVFHFLFSIIKLRSSLIRIDREEELEERRDILSIFSRPETITEKEISISKEKRTCLVCKKDLSRIMYICPKCYAFYCKNCSDTLSNRENACWVCNTPFDPTKPVKLLEEAIKSKDEKKKGKKIAIVTIIDLDFYEKVERFKWDENEKNEFIKSMLALSPIERNKIINEIIEMAESINKGESYFEEDFS